LVIDYKATGLPVMDYQQLVMDYQLVVIDYRAAVMDYTHSKTMF
jgi:hypothetical protein